jgi:ElaA protein
MTVARKMNDGILVFITVFSAIKTSSVRTLSIPRTFSGNQDMTIDWVCKHHSDLGKEQLYAILQLRDEVFVVEQKCVYHRWPGPGR